MYKRVLVPLDGSAYSEEVLPFAALVSRTGSAQLTIFRATSDPKAINEAEDYLRRISSEYSANAAQVALGDAAEAIVQEANKGPRSLVVMTSHAKTGLMETLVGSVAHKVMHTIDRPVVLFRPKGMAPGLSDEPEIRTIVLAMDGSPVAEKMEDPAAQLAKWLGLRILVIQVLPAELSVPHSIRSGDVIESGYVSLRAARMAERHAIETDWEVLHGNPADALCDFVANLTDAMLAMSSRGHGAAREMLFGSVSAECLRRSGVPLLIQSFASARQG